jgi:ribonuclease PH
MVEVQGTAEGAPFRREGLAEMLDLAEVGISELLTLQRTAMRRAG